MKLSPLLRHILLIVILLLAVYLRLAYLAEIRAIVPGDNQIFCGDDAAAYDQQAQAGLQGNWPENKVFDSVPLYPFFLISLYRLFGINYLVPLIVQMLLDVAACAAMYWVGKFTFSKLTGLLTALALAVYGPPISYQVCYGQLSLTTPFLVFSIFFFFKFFAAQRWFYLVMSGAMLGLCALSRPTMLVLLPVLGIWLFWQKVSFRYFIWQTAWLLAGLILVISPITLHNYRATGKFVLISEQGDINFYFGNDFYTNGIGPHNVAEQYSQKLGDIFSFPAEYSQLVDRVAAGETTFLQQALIYITTQPRDWLELMVNKVYLMFLEPDWKLILTSFVYPGSSAALKESLKLQLLPVEWATLVVMALLAVVFVRNRYKPLFLLTILAVSSVLIAFFIKFRFRVSLAPLLLLLTFSLIAAGRRWFYYDRRKFLLVLFILLGLFPLMPDIWIFIGLYILVGLFPTRSYTTHLWSLRWPIALGWSYLVLMSFVVAGLNFYRANAQTQDYYTGPEIWGETMIGQTFVPNCNGLQQIDLELSRLDFQHNQPYIFHLVKALNLEDEIYSTQFKVAQTSRWIQQSFTFPPIPDSRQQLYFFYINSPTSRSGNSLTVRLNADLPTVYNRYEPGTVYGGIGRQLQPFPADLAFAAYCRPDFQQLFSGAAQYMADSMPVALPTQVYYALVFMHLALFVGALVKSFPLIKLNR